ncbi:MAG: polysaccharide biosynthesis tyrosine autokinase [Calditrichaeota bacterium]|nr:MAG: polysaccharide biosynthesis tyrosine autokinase [Calditrichota bacterium]
MALEEFEILDQPQQSSIPIDFGKFIAGIWRRKWLILFLSVGMTIPFYFHAKNQVPQYKSKVVIQSKQYGSEEKSFFDAETQAEITSQSFTERMARVLGLAILSSDTLYRNVSDVFAEYHTTSEPVVSRYKIEVDDLGVYYLYQKNETSRVLVDSANVWDAVDALRNANGLSFRLQPTFVHQAGEFHFRVQPFSKGVKVIQLGIKMDFSRSGKFMIMEMKGENPNYITSELNRIADAYLIEVQKLKSVDSDTYREALRRRLAAAETNMKVSEENLRNFYSQYPLSLDAEKTELMGQLKLNEQALRDLPLQRKQLTSLLARLQAENNADYSAQYRRVVVNQIANYAAMSNEPEMTIYRQNLEQLEARYRELSGLYSSDNEEVKGLEEKIGETQAHIIQFASNYRNVLAERESTLRREKLELESKLKSLPNDEYRLMELERNKKIDEDLFKFLYTEVQKLQVSEASQDRGVRILDYAVPPTKPINPSKKSQIMLGGGLGLLLGLLLSIVIDLADRSLQSVKDVERHLKLPVLGTIPEVLFKDIPEYRDDQKAEQIDKQLVTHDYSPTPIGEAYRALRTHLLFSKDTEQLRSLLITSICPEEGKSFTAANLAIIMAQQRTNTLLVDADLRRGVQHNTFNVPREPGLTNYLSNKGTLNTLIHSTHIPNLSVMSCGSLVPNPSELLGSIQMKRLLSDVKRKFDFIIFDAPPLDAATDSVVIGTVVDAVTIVLRAGKTNRKIAKERLEIFQNVPAKIIGTIINGTDEAILKSTYSYYHY